MSKVKQTSKKMVSLLIALMMLISMMTAVTVGAEEYTAIQKIDLNFEDAAQDDLFELTDHAYYQSRRVDTWGCDSAYCLGLRSKVNDSVDLCYIPGNSQRFEFKKGASYQLSFKARVGHDGDSKTLKNLKLIVETRDLTDGAWIKDGKNNNEPSPYAIQCVANVGPTWGEYTATCTISDFITEDGTPLNVDSVLGNLAIRAESGADTFTSADWLRIDDLKLVEVETLTKLDLDFEEETDLNLVEGKQLLQAALLQKDWGYNSVYALGLRSGAADSADLCYIPSTSKQFEFKKGATYQLSFKAMEGHQYAADKDLKIIVETTGLTGGAWVKDGQNNNASSPYAIRYEAELKGTWGEYTAIYTISDFVTEDGTPLNVDSVFGNLVVRAESDTSDLASGDWIRIDDFKLTEMETLTELNLNFDGETAEQQLQLVEGNQVLTACIQPDWGYGGGDALGLRSSAADSADLCYIPERTKQFEFKKGATYQLSFRAMEGHTTLAPLNLKLIVETTGLTDGALVKDEQGNLSSSAIRCEVTLEGRNWEKGTATCTIGDFVTSDGTPLNVDSVFGNLIVRVQSGTSNLPAKHWVRIDDFKLTEVEKGTATVTIEGDGGTVTKDGNTVTSGQAYSVVKGSEMTLNVVAKEGYTVAVTQDGTTLTPNANNDVTFTVNGNTAISVTFTKKSDVSAGIAEGVSYKWFKVEEGTPTVFVFSKLNAFTVGENLEYGIYLWDKEKETGKVKLYACDPVTQKPAVAEANAMFAIRAYGDAIKTERSYGAQPFVGEETGSVMDLTFETE